ncbi:MAG: hypothetical protein AAB336_02260 [Acidobacteriota bacterium]
MNAQDLKIEEVVAKHTDSIGKSDKRKELKNMLLLGTSEFSSKLPERKSAGKVAIVSDAANLMVLSSFAADSYPFEKIGIFDSKLNIPFINPGVRSPLGDFLWEHPSILKSGLFSGSMSLQWLLLDSNFKNGKIKLAGNKKIDGRKAHIVDYYPQGTSESLKIRLYFDSETFQHVRSEYREEYTGKEATFGQLGQVNGYVMQLIETYKDYKTYDDITLPSNYTVKYMGSSSKGTWEYDWTFKLNEVKFNQPLKEGFFNF